MSAYDLLPKLFLTNGTVKTTGTSANLTAGQIGLYDPFTHQVITTGNASSHPLAYIAQGSFYVSDKLGSFMGGYKESIKSPAFTKGIDPKKVKRWYKAAPVAQQNQVVRLFWDGGSGAGPLFTCGKTYYLRLEVKGEPVLRYINRYLYKHLGAYTGCCANDCSAGCTDDAVDAALILQDYATQINTDPLLSNFIFASAYTASETTTGTFTAAASTIVVASATGIVVGQTITGVGVGGKVTNVTGTTITSDTANTGTGTASTVSFSTVVDSTYTSPTLVTDKAAVKAGLLISVIYSDTTFADCSFNQADYYNQAFIEVLASMVNQDGDPCTDDDVIMNSTTPVNFYEVTPFKIPNGSGEIILREFIASQLQSGIFFSNTPRDRETTNNVALTAVSRAASYTRYALIYSLEITGNPSNALSHDQYILYFAIKTTDSATAFEALMLAWLQAFNPGIVLETIA